MLYEKFKNLSKDTIYVWVWKLNIEMKQPDIDVSQPGSAIILNYRTFSYEGYIDFAWYMASILNAEYSGLIHRAFIGDSLQNCILFMCVVCHDEMDVTLQTSMIQQRINSSLDHADWKHVLDLHIVTVIIGQKTVNI